MDRIIEGELMKKLLGILVLVLILIRPAFATDEKSGRYFTDQPDVNDDFQIHFIYLVAKDGKDGEQDINGEMEEVLLEVNETMFKETAKNEYSGDVGKKYKFDYRKDGKIDITFVRLDKYYEELHKHANNDIAPYLWNNNFNDPKKLYFVYADINSVDGGEAGVGMGSIFLKSRYNKYFDNLVKITLHELHHTQGGGWACIEGVRRAHFNSETHQLGHGLELNENIYIHDYEGCPQLVDSVYLTPTSEKPYDPYQIICLKDLGRYTHPKLVKQNKMGKKLGSYCRWRRFLN